MTREVTLTGVLRWRELEGGVYVLQGDDGRAYDLHGVEAHLPTDRTRPRAALRVRVRGQRLEGVADIHMVGPVVQVRDLEVLGEAGSEAGPDPRTVR